jgi:acetyl-CoA C-acetyltransferase
MSTPPSDRTPVIVAIGEIAERPEDLARGREPVALMADAVRAALADGLGAVGLESIDSIELVGQITWRYLDPVGLLCERLGIAPSRKVNASMGGDTPIRLMHQAALRIQRGESQVAVIVGGEALNTLSKARAAKIKLDWTAPASREEAVHVEFEKLPLSGSSKAVGMTDPAHIYPLYENATQAAWQQTPQEGRHAAANLWARYAAVAADNPYAWLRTKPSSAEIGTPAESNRMVSFPYPKLMVANPTVNQAAAVIITSLGQARAAGLADERLVFLWGGAAAQEPEDYLLRDSYQHSTAQEAVLRAAVSLADAQGGVFDLLELYSCFPIVPKLACATLAGLGVRADIEPTVTGGLTFFGGPLNNYMTHAVCAMVRKLRERSGRLGLLYAQGGVVSKHHALVVSTQPPARPLDPDYSVQSAAEAARGPVPEVLERYVGPAQIETYTVIYGPKGHVLNGVVVARTPAGHRLIARVLREDATSLALLTDLQRSPIGADGHVRIDTYDTLVWEEGQWRDRSLIQKKYCRVEREGRITLITLCRPEAMNALHPRANEELAEVFDDFQADPEQWVAIMTGAGEKAFSAGNDLKYTAEAMARGDSLAMPATGFAGLTARWNLTKPVIAAVNGIAMGGGFEIALACDLVIAAEEALFALPEPKVGLAALEGGLHRLPRQIGLKRAMGLILTGRRVSAREGLELGFVNEVTSQAQLLARARHWAQEILACSPMAIRASKEVVLKGLDEVSLRAALEGQLKSPALRALARSDDVREGPAAFVQRRAPDWKGR